MGWCTRAGIESMGPPWTVRRCNRGGLLELALAVVLMVGKGAGEHVWVQSDAAGLGVTLSTSAGDGRCHTGSPELVLAAM